eukprot:Skav232181  [mRNA]  locus=scaffold4523:11300:16814:- [translate_table: standard]
MRLHEFEAALNPYHHGALGGPTRRELVYRRIKAHDPVAASLSKANFSIIAFVQVIRCVAMDVVEDVSAGKCLHLWVALLSGEKAALQVCSNDTVRSVRVKAQKALQRPLLGLARSDSPAEVPLPKDATMEDLQIPENSVLFALVGRLRVKSTRFAFAACQGDGSAVAWGSPFAGGDASEVAEQLAEDVQAGCCNGSLICWGCHYHGVCKRLGICGTTARQISIGLAVTFPILSGDTAHVSIGEVGAIGSQVVAWGAPNAGGNPEGELTEVIKA